MEEPETRFGLKKQGAIIIRALVADAQYAFDYPAKFLLDHPDIAEVLCYTATYTGQAEAGEVIEVGAVENQHGGRFYRWLNPGKGGGGFKVVGKGENLPAYNAIIFDMDGLILDTETTYFTAWQQAAKQLGYIISDDFCASLSGLPFSVIGSRLADYIDRKFPFAEFYNLSGELWRKRVQREGIAVKRGEPALPGGKRALLLATNSPEANARECLSYAGMSDVFEILVCRDHVPQPAAAIFPCRGLAAVYTVVPGDRRFFNGLDSARIWGIFGAPRLRVR
ncbi:MAG: HAD hydrolase-like protein [Candidatus Methanofishera endochildressiae]|uniref:HAD hydrolase-like protein n=1 Tax=Candidatus Methanofishera endochildressiae TaxID=2738884 RepID=A0A7Z0MMW3_9GAMM|nr:HAD hydrolase-like protein [Candidatus Methanofishera endochildressiae]